MKELKKAAKEKQRDDDSKWKEMYQKLEILTTLGQNLSTTGLTGPAPAPASHPAPTSSAALTSTPYGVPYTPAHPALTGSIPAYTGNPAVPLAGIATPIGLKLGTEAGKSSSERSILSVWTVGDIEREARTTGKERSKALEKRGKEGRRTRVK